MSEYKLISVWAKEIGIVPGMKFENTYGSIREIIFVDGCNICFSTDGEAPFTWKIFSFEDDYKLIYDPRNKSKQDIQKEICQKESELASLKEKLKELNKFKFVKGKFYRVRFDDKYLFGYYDGIVFNNFGNVYWIHHYDTYTDISNGNLGETLEYVYEVLGNPTLSELVSGNIKTTNNLIKNP